MKLNRKFAVMLCMALACFAVKAQAQVYVGFGYGYAPYYAPAPVYSAPVYSAPVTTYYTPAYTGYVAPAPISYQSYYAPTPVYAAPIGYGVYPRGDFEIEYKYKNGIWTYDIDD